MNSHVDDRRHVVVQYNTVIKGNKASKYSAVHTGLLCDSTPTAGSHGRLRSRERASAPAAPVFIEDDSNILSIRDGT